jgi:hypothetical protein
LGKYPAVSLSKARDLRNKERLKVKAGIKAGIDPLHEKDQKKAGSEAARKEAESRKKVFSICADDYIESNPHEWKSR